MAVIGDLQSFLRSQERLAELRHTALSARPTEEALERLTCLACRALHAPLGMVSLWEEGRHFQVSCLGSSAHGPSHRELPPSPSLSPELVALGEPLIVKDTREPPLLRESLALQELGAMAYAGVPLISSGGHVLGTFCVLDTVPRDWTDDEVNLLEGLADSAMTELGLAATRELQLENARLLQTALEGVRSRDEFLSIAAHELRTPLTSLKLQLETLRHRLVASPIKDPRVMRPLERTGTQVQRLLQLVERLVDVSSIATGRLGLLLEEMDLSALATEVTDRFHEEAEAAGCQVEVHTPGPVRGVWDQLRLEQVLSNLLSNAIKYGAGHSIDVAVECPGEVARISVKDRGIGLAREDTRRIFDRFERAVSPKHYGGMGLGLYVARQIIEAHGGSIVVRSQPGRGATFIVVLPRNVRPHQLTGREEAPAASHDTGLSGGR